MKARLKTSLALLIFAQSLSTAAFAAGSADTFKARCSACHGATGAGDTTIGKHLQLRHLGSPEVQKQSDDKLAAIITAGKGRMPAYGTKLKKEEMAGLVKFIRELKK